MSRRLLVPLAVAVLVAGATTAATLSWPVLPRGPAPARPPTTAAVVERTLACPNVSGAPARVSARASVATLPGLGGPGRAAMTGLGGSFPVPLPALATAGSGKTTDVRVIGGITRVDAGGSLAAGVGAELVTRSYFGPARGLAETRCAAAAADTWFVGGSTAVGATAALLLVNTGEVMATANLSLLTATGRVAPRIAQGIEVAPRSSVTVALESLAPNLPALATHVVVVSGRLAAILVDSRHRAKVALGVDYVPPTAGPARSAVVPGLLAGPGPRLVSLAVPGPDDATVELRVITADGSFVPASLNAVTVPAGTVAQVDLAGVLAGRPAGVVLSSDVPVIAGGFSSSTDPRGQNSDFAWSAATSPLAGPALLPDNRVPALPLARSVLLLTAPDTAATVALTALTGRSSGVPARAPVQVSVRVPAGRTVAVPLQSLAPAAADFSLVVAPMPGSGPVYGSRQLYEEWSGGLWLSQLALVQTEATVRVPVVVGDPAAGVP